MRLSASVSAFWRDPVHFALQCVESQRTRHQCREDQDRPLVGNLIKDQAAWAGGILRVALLFHGGFLEDTWAIQGT